MKHRFIFLLVSIYVMIGSMGDVMAQTDMSTINPLDEAFFRSMIPNKDSIDDDALFYREKIIKRFSFHFNAVDWALTLPNVGIEFDFDKTAKNNRSILVFGKFNGNTKHTVKPKFVFNLAQVRLEFRKYWRTGKIGMGDRYHEEYKKMNLIKPDTLWRKVTVVNEFGEEEEIKEPYFTPEDSLIMNDYDGDPNRGRFSNMYENARRLISTRTMENSRNWRAYYIGAFAAWNKYSYCIGKKGEQGTIYSVGAAFGWSVPILAARYPKEGGLDLDLGLNVGLPIAKYEGYRYVYQENNSHYTHDGRHSLSDGWGINLKHVLQDIHISLVYRFRAISHKVSLALVDDYAKHIQAWEDRQKKVEAEKREIGELVSIRLDSIRKREAYDADSTSWADRQRRDYLVAMLEIYPDKQLQGQDSLDYIRLILGKDFDAYAREKAVNDREAKRVAELLQDSIDRETRRIEKQQRTDSITAAKQARRDSLAIQDSLYRIEKQRINDSIAVVKDSLAAIEAAEKAAKKAERDAERAAKEEAEQKEKAAQQAIKNAERRAKLAEQAEARKAKEAAEAIKNAAAKAIADSIEAVKKKERITQEADKEIDRIQREKERQAREAAEAAKKAAMKAQKESEKEAKAAAKAKASAKSSN